MITLTREWHLAYAEQLLLKIDDGVTPAAAAVDTLVRRAEAHMRLAALLPATPDEDDDLEPAAPTTPAIQVDSAHPSWYPRFLKELETKYPLIYREITSDVITRNAQDQVANANAPADPDLWPDGTRKTFLDKHR